MNTVYEKIEYIIRFLAKQGKPSLNINTGMCLYRSEDGSMCAVGCLIPDNLYERVKDNVEGNPVEELIDTVEGFPLKDSDKYWSKVMQGAHDISTVMYNKDRGDIYQPIDKGIIQALDWITENGDLNEGQYRELKKIVESLDWKDWTEWRLENNLSAYEEEKTRYGLN